MLSLHRDKIHKFKNGRWTFDKENEKLKFRSHSKQQENSHLIETDLEFADYINEAEEKIFREIFQRADKFIDSDVITIQDIKNIVLFTMKSDAHKVRYFMYFGEENEFS